MNKTLLLVVDGIIVIALLVVAVVYWTHPANQLPGWFPGHSATSTTVHVKHGLAAVIVALAAAAYGWFATGPKASDGSGGGSGSVPKQ
jgi:hypothetical protein